MKKVKKRIVKHIISILTGIAIGLIVLGITSVKGFTLPAWLASIGMTLLTCCLCEWLN